MWKYFVAVLAIVLAGCGGSGSAGSRAAISASSGTDIRNALDKAGLSCTDYKSIPTGDREWGTESAADVGRCKVENEKIVIIIWKDNGQRENWIGTGKKTACELGKSFSISPWDFVDGGLWTVSDRRRPLPKRCLTQSEVRTLTLIVSRGSARSPARLVTGG